MKDLPKKLGLAPSVTLGEAAALMIEHSQEKPGVLCPCCGELSLVYDRPFHVGMARVLIALYRLDQEAPNEWQAIEVVSKRFLGGKQAGDHGKMAWWGLVERPDGEREDGNPKLGRWRITERGRLFVRGRVTIVARVIEYRNVPQRFYGDLITIREALGEKFSYRELMGQPLGDMQPRSLL